MSFRYVIETENPIVTDGNKMFNCNDGKLRLRIVEDNHWHTEKPTEDGTFLVLWKDTEEPIRRYSVLHWNEYNDTWYDEETSYCNWGDEDHAEVIAWQKIEPYKEKEDVYKG